MSDDAFDIFYDPSKETRFRWQREKETRGTATNEGPPPWKEGDRLNDFVLERLLGWGSSGFVYRALDVRTNRRCALKLLAHGSPDDLLRNKLGFRRMMSIEHPNLVRVDRIYQLGTYIALSMEEIEGVTLRKAVLELKTLDLDEAYQRLLALLRDYASGLAKMHAQGYIHRDVKPDNLMVDGQGRGRVIDYGLVDTYELDQATYGARGFLLGTPHYFAPEVIWSQRYLPAGDIFSLGIVMLDALRQIQSTSERGHAELERSNFNQHDDAERIDEAIEDLTESVPVRILEACREMLERYPSERPTAHALSRLGVVSQSPQLLWPHAEEPIVGRDAARREIVAWVEDVFCGNVSRLHLTGPSGIGKSLLVTQVIRHIEAKNWGQVFYARCRVREDQPLQAFDQICDAITNRYMRGDREPMELDPVSVGVLQEIFPVLKSVFTCNMHASSQEPQSPPVNPLEAAARMSDQLRLVGPLFLIVDDSQWADRDSLNVLDRLQTAVGREGLGIITVSREPQDPQRLPSNKHVHLGPLDLEDSITVLQRSADRWMVNVPAAVVRELAASTGGSPFRLRELADEFRPGGMLAELTDDGKCRVSLTSSGQIDQLWKQRAKRLSREAQQVLTFVVTAGGRVSTQQLGDLTGLADSVDAAVSELTRQRLIVDEATGGECITIFHDHVADGLVKTLSDQAIREAHHAWAALLSRRDHSEALAARIAGHFFAAGEPGRAVSHAILAAEDAERRAAITEAGRWYERVIDHLDGAEKLRVIRNAARCFHRSDYPHAAADLYQQLAELGDENERIECQMLAITMLIRSGRFTWARQRLKRFARSLGLPRPKPAWQSRLLLFANQILPGRHQQNISLHGADIWNSDDTVSPTPDQACATSEHEVAVPGEQDPFPTTMAKSPQSLGKLQTVATCDSLIRPLSIVDNLYAAELSRAASRLATKYGSRAQRIRIAISESVLKCYDRGIRRIAGETNLLSLKPHVTRLNCPFTTGELWAGIAFSHALACRWDQVSAPVRNSLQHYQQVGSTRGFELDHAQWLDLWADWNLGRWRQMRVLAERMLEDSLRRNDRLQHILTTSGLSGSAFLATDGIEASQRIRAVTPETDCELQHTPAIHFFEWIASMQRLLYQGQYREAWTHYESREPELRRLPHSTVQLYRVSRDMLGALTALHNLFGDFHEHWRLRAQVRINRLRRERLPHAKVLADLFEGLQLMCVARQQSNRTAHDSAQAMLLKAREGAAACHLRPYQLAAADKLAEMQVGHSSGCLEQRMTQHGILQPTCFSRLYVPASR